LITGEKRSEEALTTALAAQKSHFWENAFYGRRKFRDAVSAPTDSAALGDNIAAESTPRSAAIRPRQ
jgi:hypothetical protein